MRIPRRLSTAIGIGAAVAVIATACSSSGGSSSPASPVGGSSSVPGTTDPTGGTSSAGAPTGGEAVKIGFICSCTGPLGAANASARNVIQAWAKYVNDNGGLGGHPVELVLEDSQSQPGAAVTGLQSLLHAGVVAIVDADILDVAWGKYADDANIPVIGGNLASDQYSTDANFYPSGQTNDSGIASGVRISATRAGVTKLAYLYCAESPVCATNVGIFRTQTKKDGISLVYSASISATAPNYTAQCLAAKQAGADGLWVGDGSAVTARVVEDCAKQGYTPTLVTIGTGLGPEMLKSSVANKNVWVSFADAAFVTPDATPIKKMDEVLDKYDPGLREQDIYNQFSVQFWGAGLLLEAAAKNAGITADTAVTADVIRSGLDKIKHETLGGFSPSLTFTAGQPHPVHCYYTVHIQNGKAEPVGGQECTG